MNTTADRLPTVTRLLKAVRNIRTRHVLLFLAVVVGLALLGWITVQWVAGQKWAERETRAKELLSEARERISSRPVLRGQTVPGNAWEDYTPALERMALIEAPDALERYVMKLPGSSFDKAWSIARKHLAAIDLMRRGVRRERGQFPYEWDKGYRMKQPDYQSVRALTSLMVARARMLAEEKDERSASEHLLDLAQFGRDLCENTVLIQEVTGTGVVGTALSELRDLITSGVCSPDTLRLIESELEVLGDGFPGHDPNMWNEVLVFHQFVLDEPQWGSVSLNLPNPVHAWRYGFSVKLMLAVAAEELDASYGRVAGSERLPWRDLEAEYSSIHSQVMDSSNEFLKAAWPGASPAARGYRATLARLRLLRIGVHYLLTGRVLQLTDPLGETFLHKTAEERLTVWSVGGDGVDNGGVGTWESPGFDGDIVLELSR